MNKNLQKFLNVLKEEEYGQASKTDNQTVNFMAVSAVEENKSQKTGGKIMGRFSNRSTQYPGRIKLMKVGEEGSGTIYDCTPAEGEVFNAGTPLDAETLNALEDELKASMKLYRHRVHLTGASTNGATPVGVIEVYTTSGTAITSASALAAAMGITSSTDVLACGLEYSGNNTVQITSASVSEYSVYLRGMYYGYSSGTGSIERIYVSVSKITDSVSRVI